MMIKLNVDYFNHEIKIGQDRSRSVRPRSVSQDQLGTINVVVVLYM